MDREVFDKFSRMYPRFAEATFVFTNLGLGEFEARMTDGTCVIYDSIENTLIFPNESGLSHKDVWTEEFGRRLKKKLYARGITQTEVADYCDVSQAKVSRWLTGKTLPDIFESRKIEDLIGCAPCTLVP